MKRKKPTRPRPKLLPITEEMREWSAMLETEVSGWPRVTTRPMFGFLGLYRAGAIFAALPRTRAVGSPTSFIMKFDSMPQKLLRNAAGESRIQSERQTPGAGWYTFELSSASDLKDALWWLNQAYEVSHSRPMRKRSSRSHATRAKLSS